MAVCAEECFGDTNYVSPSVLNYFSKAIINRYWAFVLVVIVLTLNTDDLSSNPSQVYNCIRKSTKIKQKRPWLAYF